jgi:hypothetical protein
MVIDLTKILSTLKMDPEEVYKRFPPGCMVPLRSLVYMRSERKAVARALHVLVEHGRVLKYTHHLDPYETYTNMYMRTEDDPNPRSLYLYRHRHKKSRIVPYIPEKEPQEPEEEEQEERHPPAITLDDYLIGI